MEIGLYNFGDSMPDAATGAAIDQGTRLRNLLEEIEVADAVGLDVVALGEHHRPEFAVSSPSTVLAAAATRTERIRLSSGVTVLGSEDPIRVYQQFATIDVEPDAPAATVLRATLMKPEHAAMVEPLVAALGEL